MSIELAGRTVTLSRSLPATKTHGDYRSYRLVSPAVHQPTGQRWLATVSIQQGKVGLKRSENETYLLDEIAPEHLPRGWRRFYFVCQSRTPTPDRPGAYAVDVDNHGKAVKCECLGAVTQLQTHNCKHKDVINDLFSPDCGFFGDPADLPTLY